MTEPQSSYIIRLLSKLVIACSKTYRESLFIKPLLYASFCIWALNVITLIIIVLIINQRQDLLMLAFFMAMTLHVCTFVFFAYLASSYFIDKRRFERRINSLTSIINLIDRLRMSVLKNET